MVDANIPHRREPFKMTPDHIFSDPRLTKSAKLVYPFVADEVRRHGVCTLGWGALAKRTCLSQNGVRDALLCLERAGIITIKRGKKGHPNHCNLCRGNPCNHCSTATTAVVQPLQGYTHAVIAGVPMQSLQGQDKKKNKYKKKMSTSSTETSSVIDLLGEPIKPPEPKTKKPREPDPVWDEVVRIWGFTAVDKDRVKARRVGLLVSRFKANLNGGPINDIERRRTNYLATYAECADTPEALLKHWDGCNNGPLPRNRTGRLEAPAGKYANLKKTIRIESKIQHPTTESSGPDSNKSGAAPTGELQERLGCDGGSVGT